MDKSVERLVDENIALAKYTAGKLIPKYTMIREEVYSLCLLGLFNAAKAYDPTKGYQFNTYATKVMTNEVLMFLRAWNRDKLYKESFKGLTILNDEESKYTELPLAHTQPAPDVLIAEREYKQYVLQELQNYLNTLSERDKGIIRHYYEMNVPRLTQRSLATKYGLSQVHISRILVKHMTKFRIRLQRMEAKELERI